MYTKNNANTKHTSSHLTHPACTVHVCQVNQLYIPDSLNKASVEKCTINKTVNLKVLEKYKNS